MLHLAASFVLLGFGRAGEEPSGWERDAGSEAAQRRTRTWAKHHGAGGSGGGKKAGWEEAEPVALADF